MRFFVPSLLLLLSSALVNTSLADGADILGYDQAGSVTQRAAEQRLDAAINAEEMSEWLRIMSATPPAHYYLCGLGCGRTRPDWFHGVGGAPH